MSILLKILLTILAIAGLLTIPFGLPGTFIILISAFLYALATHFTIITWQTLLILTVAALLAEAAEAAAGVIGGKRYGSGGAGVVLAPIGGFAGAIVGAPFLFGLGAVLGALAGAFLGAVLAEILRGRPFGEALTAGWGTFLGRLAGTVIKTAVGAGMVAICLYNIFS